MNEFIESHGERVKRIARNVANNTPGIDADDVEQEIWVALLGSDRKDGPPRWQVIQNMSISYIETVMRRAGSLYAEGERLTYLYRSAEWIYTPEEIRGLLEEAFFDPIYWESTPQKDEGVTLTAKGIVVSLWDIRDSYAELSSEDQGIILRRFRDGESLENTDRKRLSRAVDRLTARINGRVPSRPTDTL